MIQSYQTANRFIYWSYISFSLIGLIILTLLTFTSPKYVITFHMQKQLTGLIFAVICLLGIVAGAFPSKCSQIFHFKETRKAGEKQQHDKKIASIGFAGHHPICGNFSAHVLQLRGKEYCAGCSGLIIGAILSLLGTVLYAFSDIYFGNSSILIFWIGFVLVVFGLLQYQIQDGGSGVGHLFLNAIFVVGVFLLIVGVNEVTSNFALETYLFFLTIYWILTRTTISRSEHNRICMKCSRSCDYRMKIAT